MAAGAARAFHCFEPTSTGRGNHTELEDRRLLSCLRSWNHDSMWDGPGNSRHSATVGTFTGTNQPDASLPAQSTAMDFSGRSNQLAVTLLTGAGLLLRSLDELSHVSAGFERSHVLTFQITGSWGETAEMKTLVQRIDRTLDGLRHCREWMRPQPGHASGCSCSLPVRIQGGWASGSESQSASRQPLRVGGIFSDHTDPCSCRRDL